MLAGLSAVLWTDESGCRLVDQCRDAVTTFDAIRTHRPAVAVVKLEMDGALDLVRLVRRSRVPCGIIPVRIGDRRVPGDRGVPPRCPGGSF